MNIYVGNLPYSVKDEDLREIFAGVGAVDSARVIADRFTGQSKGFGFVEMTNDNEAQRAISEINGKEIDGRQIKVNEARPKTERPDRGPRRGGGGGGGGDRW